MKFVDISGVGNSGKSAVSDLLREVNDIYVPHNMFEFDFIRAPGGLLDFRHCLLEDWSPIRSHAAYLEFISLANKMGIDPEPWNLPGLLQSTSQRYDRRFKGQFRSLSYQFADSFKVGSYKAEWPFNSLRQNQASRFVKKVVCRLGFRNSMFTDVCLLDSKNFDENARHYLERLYSLIVPKRCDSVVLNNSFEPFNPGPGLDMLNARQIVVTRDPRDIYVSGLNQHDASEEDKALLPFDNDGINKSFLSTDNLELFVKRYRLYNEKLFKDARKDVLHVSFERLIMDPTLNITRILKFLNIDLARHENKNRFFVPSASVNNVGIWRRSARNEEIEFIESELHEYLVET